MKPIEQSFSVAYEYKLYFTQHLFDIHNLQFHDVLEGYKKNGRVKLLFVIDDGVANHHPQLLHDIKAYCDHFHTSLEHTDSILVTGGEQCKNDYAQVDKVLKKN